MPNCINSQRFNTFTEDILCFYEVYGSMKVNDINKLAVKANYGSGDGSSTAKNK